MWLCVPGFTRAKDNIKSQPMTLKRLYQLWPLCLGSALISDPALLRDLCVWACVPREDHRASKPAGIGRRYLQIWEKVWILRSNLPVCSPVERWLKLWRMNVRHFVVGALQSSTLHNLMSTVSLDSGVCIVDDALLSSQNSRNVKDLERAVK